MAGTKMTGTDHTMKTKAKQILEREVSALKKGERDYDWRHRRGRYYESRINQFLSVVEQVLHKIDPATSPAHCPGCCNLKMKSWDTASTAKTAASLRSSERKASSRDESGEIGEQ